MIRTPFFSMVNLVAGRNVVPELIQDDFTPRAVAAEVRRLLESSAAREEMKAGSPRFAPSSVRRRHRARSGYFRRDALNYLAARATAGVIWYLKIGRS